MSMKSLRIIVGVRCRRVDYKSSDIYDDDCRYRYGNNDQNTNLGPVQVTPSQTFEPES